MPAKKPGNDPQLDDEIFAVPDELIRVVGSPPSRKSGRGKSKTKGPTPKQGFLPGLSRRGRPRVQQAVSSAERTAANRKKRLEAGYRRVELVLPGAVADGLDALAEHFKESRPEVIRRLVEKALVRITRRSGS